MSVNAVVGETNDGLNDIRRRALTSAQILDAIKSARSGPVEEGAVGAVLVQTNFGGMLTVDGRRIGEELGRFYLKDELAGKSADGSIMRPARAPRRCGDRPRPPPEAAMPLRARRSCWNDCRWRRSCRSATLPVARQG